MYTLNNGDEMIAAQMLLVILRHFNPDFSFMKFGLVTYFMTTVDHRGEDAYTPED